MKILVCHNFYQQRGGEDRVYEAETRLLEAHGHDVVRYEARNDVIGPSAGLAVAASTIWNPFSYRAIRRVIRAERPSLMHVHNTLPLISPSPESVTLIPRPGRSARRLWEGHCN